ncbi:MAG: DUF3793 family protein [Synergistaceae bacterium]|nr:DUF3793 family protein [Synergistaceae bacterium]
MTLIRNRDTGEYIESLIACFAAPTIRGLKSGSLLNLRRHGDGNIAAIWDAEKEELLRKFQLEAFAFPPRPQRSAWGQDAVLLLLYKKELLARALFTEKAAAILHPLGYDCCPPCVESYLERLGERWRIENNFPHEIGLFLNYPPEDVREFIRHRGQRSLATGYWKVYGNVRKAKRTFQQFRQAEYEAARSLIRQAGFSAGS